MADLSGSEIDALLPDEREELERGCFTADVGRKRRSASIHDSNIL
jgi:hypothetical protein